MAGGFRKSAISSLRLKNGRAPWNWPASEPSRRIPRAMGQKFTDRRFRNLGMHLAHILADFIIKAELSLLAKLHKPGGDKAFGVRGDTKSMARSELFLTRDIGVADRPFEYDLIAMRNSKDTARLL
jgi:hypothetical protein